MPEITAGVSFDTVGREVRCKWSPDNDKASLAACQKVLETFLPKLKAVDGVKSVQRLVCGDCFDFKVLVSVEEPKFGGFMEANADTEAAIVGELGKIDGVQMVDTQTITVMPV
eukprot:CAMPEP_0182916364 /NCGR_PEP_ID=MMETSP0105_2-20130417/894_1 /TAXON_ID=81532 ORGANISM="Acanthoeca-like sp., Strain 10tr" /NCGR_SAMPLE_ID=MMETSP0105_2 /ASSEMBLY_ACC=CAM_ASM_000205 /LENGTH=112 /DNA_ID=CAMNT_0025053311 /DNA_START=32 /DNA_END=370 /DNA_ORIENTATION=+